MHIFCNLCAVCLIHIFISANIQISTCLLKKVCKMFSQTRGVKLISFKEGRKGGRKGGKEDGKERRKGGKEYGKKGRKEGGWIGPSDCMFDTSALTRKPTAINIKILNDDNCRLQLSCSCFWSLCHVASAPAIVLLDIVLNPSDPSREYKIWLSIIRDLCYLALL